VSVCVCESVCAWCVCKRTHIGAPIEKEESNNTESGAKSDKDTPETMDSSTWLQPSDAVVQVGCVAVRVAV